MTAAKFQILIITESPQIASILVSKLERDGLSASWKPDGKRGFESIETEAPSLVILDSILPDLDSFRLLEKIRSFPGRNSLPVFVLLDVLQEHSLDEYLAAGARAVIQKPFRPTDISKKIRKALFSQEPAPDALADSLSG